MNEKTVKGTKKQALLAAAQVLKDAGKALTDTEISKRVIDAGLWKSKGKTPHKTIGAYIYSEIQQNKNRSLFVKTAPRTFAIRNQDGIPGKAGKAISQNESESESSALDGTLTFVDCAEKVLEEVGNKEPMHYSEITQQALSRGWLVTNGETPEFTMITVVNREIRSYQKKGKEPRFINHGDGLVGLRKWMGKGLAFQIGRHNEHVRSLLLDRVLALKPVEFERLIAALLVEMGFENPEVTQVSNDGGIDVRGTLVVADVVRTKMAIQVKKWKPGNNIGSPIVQQVRGSLKKHEQGLIITTSDFSPGAKKEASDPEKQQLIALMNGEQVVTLLMEYGIGVSRETTELFDLDEGTLEIGAFDE